MRFQVITYKPQVHIQVCHLIGYVKAEIIKAQIVNEDYYGEFILDSKGDLFNNLSLMEGIDVKVLE